MRRVKHIQNFINYKSVNDKILITNSLKSWLLLNKKEFSNFIENKVHIQDDLFRRLSERGFLLSRKNIKRNVDYYLNTLMFPAMQGPSLFIIEVTKQCNLNCLYCHADAQKKPVDLSFTNDELIRKTIDFIYQTPSSTVNIEFQGGEPLLEFDKITKFVHYAKEKNRKAKKFLNFCITTNATLLNKKILNFFSDHKFGISCTYEGEESLQNFQRPFCNGQGTHDRVIKNLQLIQASKMKYNVLTIISKKSLDKKQEIFDFFIKNNLSNITLNKVQKLGKANCSKNWEKIGITNKEFLDFWKSLLELVFEAQKKGILILERHFEIIIDKLFYSDPNLLDFRNPCGAVIGQLAIDTVGNIFPCDEARAIPQLCLGNVASSTYADILDNGLSQQIIKASVLEGQTCNTCVYRPFCGTCPVLSYKNSSEFTSQSYREFANKCTLFEGMFDYVFEIINNHPEKLEYSLLLRENNSRTTK